MSGRGTAEIVREALEVLGVRRLVFGLHDAAFPSDADENIGIGTPYGRAAARLMAFVAGLGFDAVQLGPQGALPPGHTSPYDATIFSRNPHAIAVAALTDGPEPLVSPALVASLVAGAPRDHVDRPRALEASRRVIAAAFDDWRAGPGRRPALTARLAVFRQRHQWWLEPDARYAGLVQTTPAEVETAADRWRFAQALVHEQHAAFRARARGLGLALYGDFQAGASPVEEWAHPEVWLPGYRMGAPPSRTNPEGQPWHYPVLDPRPGGNGGAVAGAALRFFEARVRKALDEYDSLRIDHPHALVCPWVYRDEPDALAAVQGGARLFESPDLPDHPRLAAFAIARPDQIDRQEPRYADGWVRSLDESQVERYAALMRLLVRLVADAGGNAGTIACEVLSTQPCPLRRVMDALGLGRFRVTQKAAVDDPTDGYRGENAEPRDWIMTGNHDTAPVWLAAEQWVATGRGVARAAYLASRLRPREPAAWIARTAADARAIARAMLADLFVGPARHVFVGFSDLFGSREPYNRPGTVDASNWSERLPPDFDVLYARRVRAGAALDLPLALATALEARQPQEPDGRVPAGLVRALRAAASLAP